MRLSNSVDERFNSLRKCFLALVFVPNELGDSPRKRVSFPKRLLRAFMGEHIGVKNGPRQANWADLDAVIPSRAVSRVKNPSASVRARRVSAFLYALENLPGDFSIYDGSHDA